MNEESNLSKALPTRFMHDCFRVLEWKWFNSRSCVGAVLVWDLAEKRMKGFLGSPQYDADEEDQVKQIADYGCRLPTDMVIVIFKMYFSREDVIQHLDKDFKLFMQLTSILDQK